jgi:hypothetical protein
MHVIVTSGPFCMGPVLVGGWHPCHATRPAHVSGQTSQGRKNGPFPSSGGPQRRPRPCTSSKTLYKWCRYLYEMSEIIQVASNDGFEFGAKLVRLHLVQHALVSLGAGPQVNLEHFITLLHRFRLAQVTRIPLYRCLSQKIKEACYMHVFHRKRARKLLYVISTVFGCNNTSQICCRDVERVQAKEPAILRAKHVTVPGALNGFKYTLISHSSSDIPPFNFCT